MSNNNNRRIERVGDDQLKGQMNAVRAHIRRTRKHGGDTRDAEIELCYLEREQEMRDIRKKAHDSYTKKLKAEEKRLAMEERDAIESFLNGEQ